jgi:addiction module RelB/DinJ family antitoxin
MTEVLRLKVDKRLLDQAHTIAAELGTSTGEIVRLCLAQLVKRRAIPFPVQMETPEDEVLTPTARRQAILDELSES